MRNMENLPGDNTARKYTYHQHTDIPYAATINLPVLKGTNEQDIYIEQLTGALTLNLPNGSEVNLQKGDRVNIVFTCDGTARTITWGTNILAPTATRQIAINGGLVVRGIYNGSALVIDVP